MFIGTKLKIRFLRRNFENRIGTGPYSGVCLKGQTLRGQLAEFFFWTSDGT